MARVYTAEEAVREPVRRIGEIARFRGDRAETIDDILAVEEPLEIRLAGLSVAVTMRTPGDDLDLAAGFLYTEGAIARAEDIAAIHYCPTDDEGSAANIVNVTPIDAASVDPTRWQRNVYTTSSCGICGRASIDQVRNETPALTSRSSLTPARLYALARALGEMQQLFGATGGLHAAALFDGSDQLVCLREDVGRHNAVDKVIGAALRLGATGGLHAAALFDGSDQLVCLREDVGRHNAVDKVIGAALRRGALPLHGHTLLVSSRASFEIVQKALAAGIPAVAAVSAASTLAVDLAREAGMTLVGFLRPEPAPGRFTVYAGASASVREAAW